MSIAVFLVFLTCLIIGGGGFMVTFIQMMQGKTSLPANAVFLTLCIISAALIIEAPTILAGIGVSLIIWFVYTLIIIATALLHIAASSENDFVFRHRRRR